jgi:hypothetical protein
MDVSGDHLDVGSAVALGRRWWGCHPQDRCTAIAPACIGVVYESVDSTDTFWNVWLRCEIVKVAKKRFHVGIFE